MFSTKGAQRMVLTARTAGEVMKANPVSIRADATGREAIEVLTDRGFGAAPVIDEAGRPVGVVSRSDVMIYYRNKRESGPDLLNRLEGHGQGTGSSQAETAAPARVSDIMTPAVFGVPSDTPANRVVGDMVGLKVHRVFVVDSDGILTGVISAFDVLRHLR